jgi:putative transposase
MAARERRRPHAGAGARAPARRKLRMQASEVEHKILKLRQQTFKTAIIERYRRRESSVEETLIEMYLAASR